MCQSFFVNNRNKFKNKMNNRSAAVFFAGCAPYKIGDEKYSFSPNRNFYYLTGIDNENCAVFLCFNNNVFTVTLYIERDNGVMAKWVGATIKPEEAKKISGISYIRYIDQLENDISDYLFKAGTELMYLDTCTREWVAELSQGVKFSNEFIKRFPAVKIIDAYNIFAEMREIKEDYEIGLIQKAIDITREGIECMLKNSKPNMMEYEIEAYFDFILTKNGVKDKAFKTIAASGNNGTILHYTKNSSMAHDGDLILFDLGAQVGWYNGDLSRTFPVNGKFTERQKLFYNIVLNGQKLVIDAIKPELPFVQLNEMLREFYFVELKKIGLVETIEEVSKYYFHNVSHSLGAETHDIGRYKSGVLKSGMVITVEPGLYIEEYGIGIRIEDDVLVTENGCKVLSSEMIKTVEEIEEFMAKGNGSYGKV